LRITELAMSSTSGRQASASMLRPMRASLNMAATARRLRLQTAAASRSSSAIARCIGGGWAVATVLGEVAGSGATALAPADPGAGRASASATPRPRDVSIHTSETPLARMRASVSASSTTKRVRQKGCDSHPPSMRCRNMPTRNWEIGIFWVMDGNVDHGRMRPDARFIGTRGGNFTAHRLRSPGFQGGLPDRAS
jgi:hypothetical protein